MSILEEAQDFVKSNIGTIGAGVAGVAVGGALGAAAVAVSNRKKTTRRKSSRKYKRQRRHGHKSKKKRTRRTPHTAGKRKDRSHKRIRYTKNGQPYVILRSGKARFISKRGAKQSRKRKGGRY